MMKLEILEEFTASNDQMIVKGKRTKRPRPSSSTSSNGGGCDGAGDFCNSLVSSPATTSSTTTEEDEDMANCLILLARGNSPPQPDHSKSAASAAENKFSSRRFQEMATTTAGKVGIFVYECKTCNRTFPSFQALGGHRASHKKPKTDAETAPPPPPPPPHDDEEREGKTPLKKLSTIISPPQSDPSKPKMHECSICGAEFGSGQALGGHMRRHRPAPKIPTSIDSNTTSSNEAAADKGRGILALDLNLPAPPDDEKLQQFPAEQQRRVVFSAASLVGCQY